MTNHRPGGNTESGATSSSRLVANIAWNYIAGFTSVFGLLLLYPMGIDMVGAETYGLWVITSGAIQLLTMSDFGLGTGIVRSLAEIEDVPQNQSRRQEFVGTAVQAFFILGTFFTVVYFALFPLYLRTLDIPDGTEGALTPMVLMAGATLLMSVIGRAFNAVLWAEDRPDIERKAAVVSILLRALGYVALLQIGSGLVGIFVVECLSLMIPPLVCALTVYRRYSWPLLRRSAWKEHGLPLIKMSSVLSIGSLSQLGVYQLPLFFVGPALGLQAATTYGALMRVYQSCRLIVSWSGFPFTYAIKQSGPGEIGRVFKSCLELTLTVGLLMSVPLVALPNELLELWLGNEFIFAGGALSILVLGLLAEALAQPSDLVLTLRGSPLISSLLRFLTLVITVPAVLWAVGTEDLTVVMMASVAPSFLVSWLQIIAASRSDQLALSVKDVWRWITMALLAVACIILMIVVARMLNPFSSVALCAAILGVTAGAKLYFIRGSIYFD